MGHHRSPDVIEESGFFRHVPQQVLLGHADEIHIRAFEPAVNIGVARVSFSVTARRRGADAKRKPPLKKRPRYAQPQPLLNFGSR
jgi:hypothetical protein